MDKIKMHTPDMAEENYRKLAELFPNAVTETIDDDGKVVRAIDADVLRQEISTAVVEGPQERYQFTWPDKKKTVMIANAPINKTLRLNKEKSVGRDGTSGSIDTENIYIEGDNLDVLKLLQETYLGKIQVIYIDPPYNTGSDFIYEDDFSQEEMEYLGISGQFDEEGNRLVQNTESNGRFHTDWLNMLYPRIRIARDLLADDGVLFISIDDCEQENLKRICNEVFGSKGFVTTIHVEMSATQGMKVKAAQNGNIVKNAEYILVYSKDGHKNIAKNLLYDYRQYDGHYSKMVVDNELFNLKDVFNEKYKDNQIKNISEAYLTNACFKQFVDDNTDSIFADDKISGFETKDYPAGKVYRVSSGDRSYYIYNNGKKIRQLLPLSASFGQCDDFDKSYGLRKIRGDWWKDFYKDMGNVSKEGDMVFENGKKPVRLIQQLIYMASDEDSIVMDFFSGSATTAHAVMQQNSEDSGNRKFIMVQLPEQCDEKDAHYKEGLKTICDIGEERIRRAGKRIKDEAGSDAGNLDFGFRVFSVDSSNMKDVYYRPADTSQNILEMLADNIKEDRTSEDLLFQIMLELGVMLSSKIEETIVAGKKIFKVADGYLIACFDDEVSEDVVTEIAKMHPFYAVFRDSGMSTDSVAINFDQIFETYSPKTQRKVL